MRWLNDCRRPECWSKSWMNEIFLWNLWPKQSYKVPTCYKNPEKPSCIDLLLTNLPTCFQVYDDLSDFHKMTVTVMKTTFEKLKPRVTYFRNWDKFCTENFKTQLLTKLSLENVNNSSNAISKFMEKCANTLKIFAHRKKKY